MQSSDSSIETASICSGYSACSQESTISAYRKINCWGSEIDDISILSQMSDLEVVILSSNSVNDLSPIANCKGLTQLMLRKNNVSDFCQLRHLRDLGKLKTLWLMDNPLAQQPDYRLKVINILPQLTKLDRQVINDEERKKASEISSDAKTISHNDVKEIDVSNPNLEYLSSPEESALKESEIESGPSLTNKDEVQKTENNGSELPKELFANADPFIPANEANHARSGDTHDIATAVEGSIEIEDQVSTLKSIGKFADCMAKTSIMSATQEVRIIGAKLFSAPVRGMMFSGDSEKSQLQNSSAINENDKHLISDSGSKSNTLQAIELLLDSLSQNELNHLQNVISTKLLP